MEVDVSAGNKSFSRAGYHCKVFTFSGNLSHIEMARENSNSVAVEISQEQL